MDMFLSDMQMQIRYGVKTAIYDLDTGETTLYTPDGGEWHKASDGTWYEQHEAERFFRMTADLYEYLKETCTDPSLPPQNPIRNMDDITGRRLAKWQLSHMQTSSVGGNRRG